MEEIIQLAERIRLGFLKNQKIEIPDDFNEMGQEEIIRLFEDES